MFDHGSSSSLEPDSVLYGSLTRGSGWTGPWYTRILLCHKGINKSVETFIPEMIFETRRPVEMRTASKLQTPSRMCYFETAFSFVRAWSIWSYAKVTISAVDIVSPLRTSDS
jgi:hypothetical protein